MCRRSCLPLAGPVEKLPVWSHGVAGGGDLAESEVFRWEALPVWGLQGGYIPPLLDPVAVSEAPLLGGPDRTWQQ